ncbi:hypothetical protein ABKN59_003589 [Abortiporus biennis]
MYRASSPIFDVPEFPTLRRVKPLPKRRRTSDPPPHDGLESIPSSPAILGPDATPEELIAHADSLSSQMALQSYYMPIVGGMPELFKKDQDNNRSSTPIDLSTSYGSSASDLRGGANEDDGGEGDYIDHLQQPGNTKKRKVPANISGAAHGHDAGSNSGGEDEPSDRAIPTGRTDSEYDAVGAQASLQTSGGGGTGQRKGKLSKATLAGLQHKEMLKSRKRQLAVVLGALSLGDTLALDQALSTSYPFTQGGGGVNGEGRGDATKVRLSRRRSARLARAYQKFRASLPLQETPVNHDALPESDFTFVCHSATSDRLVATKEEVAALHARFEAELSRQAARAAEAAKQAAAALNSRTASKRSDRSKQNRAIGGKGDQTPNSIEQSLLGTPSRGGKKKKRSALANASNPHHLRNYVPSRLPHAGQLNAAQSLANIQNLVSPLPMRFLSADVPPRRRSKQRNVAPIANLSNPADEWICPFCEFDLFYGDQHDFQRAVRNRKKILKRRRRARERAAAAASGAGPATAKNNGAAEDDVHPGFETPHEDVVAAMNRQQQQQSRGRDEGGGGGQEGIAETALG